MPGKIQVKYGLDNYEVISYSFILNQLYRIATQCKNPVQEHIDRFPFVDICFLKASSGSYYGIIDSYLKFQVISSEGNPFNNSLRYGCSEVLYLIQFGNFYEFRADNDLVCAFCLSESVEIICIL